MPGADENVELLNFYVLHNFVYLNFENFVKLYTFSLKILWKILLLVKITSAGNVFIRLGRRSRNQVLVFIYL